MNRGLSLKVLYLAAALMLGGAFLAAAPTGWAVLVQKEGYAGMDLPDLRNNCIDLGAVHWLLNDKGWPADHILEIRDPATQEDVLKGLAWLAQHAKKDDIALFYWSGHGTYVRKKLEWAKVFPPAWAKIESRNRLVLVDACHAGEFTDALAEDPNPTLCIGSVGTSELGWSGDWREGLPIIGTIFTHYWVEAMADPTADLDKDGRVSVQEAAIRAEAKQRRYMHEVVWADKRYAFPEGQKNPDYPHVPVLDKLGHPLFLDLK
jgi:hypothetical protein